MTGHACTAVICIPASTVLFFLHSKGLPQSIDGNSGPCTAVACLTSLKGAVTSDPNNYLSTWSSIPNPVCACNSILVSLVCTGSYTTALKGVTCGKGLWFSGSTGDVVGL